MSHTNDLVELGDTVSDTAVPEGFGDSGRLGDFVSDLNDLCSVGVG